MPRFTATLPPALLAAVLLAACGSSSGGKYSGTPAATQPTVAKAASSTAVTVKTTTAPSLSATVLANSQGMTLYHLSGEGSGRFICTSSACLSVWHPLTVSSGATPTGSGSLAVVTRPGGGQQVTYKGMPLYTFAQDSAEGEAKGQGIKDVGTWSAVTLGSTSSSSEPATTSSASKPAGSSYGY
jgi:predicted lipoprotein with Yx(FWY)xxD motif